MTLAPPLTPPEQSAAALRARGYAVLDAAGVQTWAGVAQADLLALARSWDALEPDRFLKDGGRYRKRRHASHIVRGDLVETAPHRAHWQPVEYNALHGGMQRWFAPIAPETLGNPAWARLVQAVVREAAAIRAPQDAWFVEAHQFRIDAADGIGRPTPEGAHRDGVDLVAVFLLARHQIRGGETRVFDAHGPTGLRFTLSEPWSLLLLDDARVIHESTPIQPDAADAAACWRDTLVLTCRSGGFLGG